MKIRRATEADVAEILNKVHHAAVHKTAAAVYDRHIIETWSAGPTPEKVKELQGRILSEEELVFVAVDSDQILGFGAIVPSLNELRAVYVNPDHGRKGVGAALLDALEALALELGLRELQMAASLNAEAFYVRHGFEVVERGEHKLRNGLKMPCVKMRKSLSIAN